MAHMAHCFTHVSTGCLGHYILWGKQACRSGVSWGHFSFQNPAVTTGLDRARGVSRATGTCSRGVVFLYL